MSSTDPVGDLAAAAEPVYEQIEGTWAFHEARIQAMGLNDQVVDATEGLPIQLPTGIDSQTAQTAISSIVTAAVARLWNGRTISVAHPGMAKDAVDLDEVLPTTLFDRLPATNPLIVFSRPPKVALPRSGSGLLLGFFVHGLDGDNLTLTSTATPDTELGLLFAVAVLDPHGGHLIEVDDYGERNAIDLIRGIVPRTAPQFTVEQAVSLTLARLDDHGDLIWQPASLHQCLRDLLQAAVGVYLEVLDPEIERAQRHSDAGSVLTFADHINRQQEPERGTYTGPCTGHG
ncbi:hypothetical protein ACQP2U_42615 (plasmid) [Nocardia sp. CA-084685]|uniref:hypothetical protein n=1 Tax=Nocardia sp. CA-084685 TaxID=3239970 RepID=UPI003D966B17